MNQIERLRGDLAKRFPDVTMELDEPADERGPWFLDVRRGDDLPPIVVEWRPDRGFGVSTPGGDDYGTGPDEVYPNVKAAFDRVVRLVLSGGRSEPPRVVRLAELRQGLGLSQEELAERAGVKQANISRIENRGDVLVSTLARILAAMGAELTIRARFPNGQGRDVVLRLPEDETRGVAIADKPGSGS
jgi:DNA-binding XRE family transcriptional regulator